MNASLGIVIIGAVMFATGLAVFYSVDIAGGDAMARFAKNAGTFVEVAGIGVMLGGALLRLIDRNESAARSEMGA